jgi:hypothetical protein
LEPDSSEPGFAQAGSPETTGPSKKTHSAESTDPAEPDLAEPGPVESDSEGPGPEELGSAEPDSALPHPAPHTTAPAAPTGPQTTHLVIADSGNPPKDERCAERRTPSSVRTSSQRVKPKTGWCIQTAKCSRPLPRTDFDFGRGPLARGGQRVHESNRLLSLLDYFKVTWLPASIENLIVLPGGEDRYGWIEELVGFDGAAEIRVITATLNLFSRRKSALEGVVGGTTFGDCSIGSGIAAIAYRLPYSKPHQFKRRRATGKSYSLSRGQPREIVRLSHAQSAHPQLC